MRTTARRVISSLLAAMLLSTAGLSQVMRPPRVARSVATVPAEQARSMGAEPIELSLREDLREACAGFPLPPEPYVIESPGGSDADESALAGLLTCLKVGPLAARELELLGPTELPGRSEAAVEAAAPGDVARALLGRLGVPFGRMVTRDVAMDSTASQHAAPRVVLAAGD